jgi:four helix bundle protein
MTIKRFEEIEAWQDARQLTKEIYRETRKNPLRRDWRFCSQIQSAAVSIMSNVAEGFHSQTNKEFMRFLSYSIRSSAEVQSLLYVALDNEYINQARFDELFALTKLAAQKTTGFQNYLETLDS